MIRSRKVSPTASAGGSAEMGTPPSSPLGASKLWYGNGSGNARDDDDENDLEDVLLAENGKERRRLFDSVSRHNVGLRLSSKCMLPRSSSNQREFLILAVLFLASNLTVGLSVFWYMSSSSTTGGFFLPQFSNAFSSNSCPQTMVEFGNWFSNTLDDKRKAAFADLRIDPSRSTKTKSFTPVPPQFYKTFYYDGKKISQPIARALRSRGWRMVDDTDNAHLIYTYNNNADWAAELLPWQRFNYIPSLEKWNRKADFCYYYKKYEEATGKLPSVYVPESYMLTESKHEIEAFRQVLTQKSGKDHPWVHKLSNVNQGKGITILPPNSPQLLELPDRSLTDLRHNGDSDDLDESIVQKYVCNELTYGGRKFDVRMYWFVASLDPLIVLYHDGYVRVGNSDYSETSFADTTSHLTSHTGLGAETKATFAQLEELLEHQAASRPTIPMPPNVTPVEHVRNQFKHALGEMMEIMKDESFLVPDYDQDDADLTAENSFQFYCADFILDKDLDVWFIEPQNGCGLDEDYYFRLEMHASLFNGMVDVLEEVGRKQEQNVPLLPLQKSGNWEIIYADGHVYNYDGYERSTNKEGCKVPKH